MLVFHVVILLTVLAIRHLLPFNRFAGIGVGAGGLKSVLVQVVMLIGLVGEVQIVVLTEFVKFFVEIVLIADIVVLVLQVSVVEVAAGVMDVIVGPILVQILVRIVVTTDGGITVIGEVFAEVVAVLKLFVVDTVLAWMILIIKITLIVAEVVVPVLIGIGVEVAVLATAEIHLVAL